MSLEKNLRKSERVVAKGKFSASAFLGEIILAAVLGAILAVIWIFRGQIEGLLGHEEIIWLTDKILKLVLVGMMGLVAVVFIIHLIVFKSKELVVTTNKIVYRHGVLSRSTTTIPLNEIKSVESKSKILTPILLSGALIIVSGESNMIKIKGITRADKLQKRIMEQLTDSQNKKATPQKVNVSFN